MVLDVETSFCAMAVGLADAAPRPDFRRAALQSLVGASMLSFRMEDGAFSDWKLVSLEADLDEAEMIRSIGTRLSELHQTGGRLITFNGSHDLSVLRRRANRHWLFGKIAADAWLDHPTDAHLDMMLLDPATRAGRFPSLVDAAAGYGFDARCTAPEKISAVTVRTTRKSQVDCVATTLLFFHRLADLGGTVEPLARGWLSLAEFLAGSRPPSDHLRQFWRHPFVSTARQFLG